jgi:hypothetical protein
MVVFIGAVFSLCSLGAAHASSFTLASFNVALATADPGLVLYWVPIQPVPVTFELNNAGDSWTSDLFRVGTTETWSNMDDKVPRDISATFDFSNPDVTMEDSGHSVGRTFFFFSWGEVRWDDPIYFDFGNTGRLSLDLNDVTFWTPGFATVQGTFTLTQADTPDPVPEPGTLILMGSGLLGLALAGSRKKFRK